MRHNIPLLLLFLAHSSAQAGNDLPIIVASPDMAPSQVAAVVSGSEVRPLGNDLPIIVASK
ncbi:hypothetical protein [Deinococcus multiflagellatus]|uniref:Uncharacterized protein n=1 Tax=Deinococcus multiflagellatus TaxID=1656887 RepID=A0ABW1ZQP0_9DEIO|nr:hypothetical protein [Deinococcus multiflagellatus]MBZ9715771.1 hypothetical protein [Deinococcus multiflagellatus]